MKTSFSRRASRRSHNVTSAEGAFFRKETAGAAYFDAACKRPFFAATPTVPTLQRTCKACEEEKKPAEAAQQQGQYLGRKEETTAPDGLPAPEEEVVGSLSTSGSGSGVPHKTAFGNCAGAHVQGRTDANYDQGTYSVTGATVSRARHCTGCAAAQCVTVRGIIVSVFQANPTVTLPGLPPSNWNACERTAIRNFIDTTLSQHEQQHVTAFHTYNGTVRTPFIYTGCQDGWEAHVAGMHDRINRSRAASANALSDALDANGANNFTITCNCPDRAPANP